MNDTQQFEQLYTFAFYMLGSADEALAAVRGVMAQHQNEPETWLQALVAPFMLRKKAPRVDRFAELDDILRTYSTIPVDLNHPLVRGDIGRLNVLLAELQRTCLLTTLRGLTVERRAVFILRRVLGLSVDNCATVCGTTTTGIAVADTRGRQDLENYLGVRCEHLDAANSCHCAARLGNALDRGFVRWPDDDESNARIGPIDTARRPFGTVSDLYAGLPRVRLRVVA